MKKIAKRSGRSRRRSLMVYPSKIDCPFSSLFLSSKQKHHTKKGACPAWVQCSDPDQHQVGQTLHYTHTNCFSSNYSRAILFRTCYNMALIQLKQMDFFLPSFKETRLKSALRARPRCARMGPRISGFLYWPPGPVPPLGPGFKGPQGQAHPCNPIINKRYPSLLF